MTGAGRSATTVLRALGVLAGILDDAVAEGRISKNAARGLDPKRREKPTKPRRKHIYLDHDAVARLADESGEHRTLVLVLSYCGIRWGELVALRVRHVDEVRRRLLVIDNAVQLGVDHAVGDPKGDEPREVPVPRFVMTELKKQIHGRGPDSLVFGDGTNYLPRPKSDGGWFAGAVKRAKVQRITPHDLRHTAASLAISAGANVLAVSRMLGHENPQMTLRTYADLFDTDFRHGERGAGHGPAEKCVQTGSTPRPTAPESDVIGPSTWRFRRMTVAVAEGFEPSDGVSRHTLSRRAP